MNLDGLPERLLTREDEATINLKSEEGLNELVLHNMREAFKYARRFNNNHIPDDELFSVCYGALMRSAKHFSPALQRFFAFAKPAIRGDIQRYYCTRDVVRHGKNVALELPSENEDLPTVVLPEAECAEDADFMGINTRERWNIIKPIIDAKLDASERRVLVLRYRSGFSFVEISRLFGVTRSAIQAIHRRALKKIRNELYRTKRLFTV